MEMQNTIIRFCAVKIKKQFFFKIIILPFILSPKVTIKYFDACGCNVTNLEEFLLHYLLNALHLRLKSLDS